MVTLFVKDFFSLSLSFICAVITALDMEAMVSTVKGWMENPVKFARSHGVTVSPPSEDPERDTHILIVEGFLIYNYKYAGGTWKTTPLHITSQRNKQTHLNTPVTCANGVPVG